MNTLQILPQLNLGGVETAVFDSVKYLSRAGHKTVVVSAGGELAKDLEALGVMHYQLPVHEKSLFTMIKMIPRVVEIIKKEEIELIHAHSRVPAWIAYFAARKARIPFITTCHGYYSKHFFSSVMGWSKRVIAISNVIARHMIEDFGVPYERIRLIPSSVDLEKFICPAQEKKKGAEFNIGIIGRLTPLKGHLYFIKAMAKVARVVPSIKIWIVGDAPVSREAYKEQIQVLVNRLGLGNCTEFLGSQKDIPAILSHLDVLVLATTVPEAFGRVIVEAQACMVPVVATRVGGVVDIIEDGKTGIMVPPADPEGMAAGVLKILKDETLARSFTEKAYEKVKQEYSAELMVKRTLGVYKEALENHKLLIIKFSSLGDIILSTAGIRAIRKKFGEGYKISLLVGEPSKDLLLNCPYIDELLVCDLKDKDKGIKGILGLGSLLRKNDFDKVIDLQNNRKSRLLAWLSASPDRYGYENRKWGSFLNHRLKDEKPLMAPVEHQFRILKMLGIESGEQHLELWPTEDDRSYIEEFLSGQWLSANQRIVGINISASSRWVTKSWSLENIAKLCEGLGRKEMRIVFTGTENDCIHADALADRLKDLKIINACGKTSVNQLACLIKRCAVYISADSSPLHIAAAMDVPFVALFGPTEPLRHTPPAKDYIVVKKDLPCGPCYKSKCKSKKCMELITPEEVLEAVSKLLK